MIRIKASTISSLTLQNHYDANRQDLRDAFEGLWREFDPKSYDAARNGERNAVDLGQEALNLNAVQLGKRYGREEVATIVAERVQTASEEAKDAVEVVKRARTEQAPPEVLVKLETAARKKSEVFATVERLAPAVLKEAEKAVNTTSGIRTEDAIIEGYFKKKTGFAFLHTSVRDMREKAYDGVTLRGFPDGLDVEKRTVVELKTRQKITGIYSEPPTKDKVQIMCYLDLFDCDSCFYVQAFGGIVRAERVVHRDEALWDATLDKLRVVCDVLRRHASDASVAKAYFAIPEDGRGLSLIT